MPTTIQTELSPVETQAALRRWACGLYGLEAAVEVLVRACGGRFAQPGWPWIRLEGTCLWLDADQIRPNLALLSGGERRLLAIVETLAAGHPIGHLAELLADFDRETLQLVLAAFAHAGGSHTHAILDTGSDGSVQWVRPGPVIDWPAA